MRSIVVGLLLVLVVVAMPIHAQAPTVPKTYDFTEVQNLKLQLAQKDAIYAFQEYQGKINIMNGLAEQFRKDNKWPDGLQFDGQNLKMVEVPKPSAAPAPETSPAPTK